MQGQTPARGWVSIGAAGFVAAALVSFLSFVPFSVSLAACEGFGCLGLMLWFPVAGVGSLICVLGVTAWARRGWRGFGLALVAAAIGFVAAGVAISALGLWPG